MQKEALQVAVKYEREARERLRRISIVAAGLDVVGARKDSGGGPAAGSSHDEAWYEDSRISSYREEMLT